MARKSAVDRAAVILVSETPIICNLRTQHEVHIPIRKYSNKKRKRNSLSNMIKNDLRLQL